MKTTPIYLENELPFPFFFFLKHFYYSQVHENAAEHKYKNGINHKIKDLKK